MNIAARDAHAMVPTLAGVVHVDSRWVPTARTRHAMPAIMRSSFCGILLIWAKRVEA